MTVIAAQRSSHCRLCDRPIRVGEDIAPLNRIWVHADCLERNERLSGR